MEAGSSPVAVIPFMVVWVLTLIAVLAFWRAIATSIGNSKAVRAALALVEANPEANAFLGLPVRVGLLILGRIYGGSRRGGIPIFEDSSLDGYASLSLPLRGTREKARMKVKLEKTDGVWHPVYARVRLGSRTLTLIDRKPRQNRFKWYR